MNVSLEDGLFPWRRPHHAPLLPLACVPLVCQSTFSHSLNTWNKTRQRCLCVWLKSTDLLMWEIVSREGGIKGSPPERLPLWPVTRQGRLRLLQTAYCSQFLQACWTTPNSTSHESLPDSGHGTWLRPPRQVGPLPPCGRPRCQTACHRPTEEEVSSQAKGSSCLLL